MTLLWCIAVFCFLASPSVRGQGNENCDGTFEIWVDQRVDLSLEEPVADISNRRDCMLACCGKRGCDLAIMKTPQGGPDQCFLVNCTGGKDVCSRQPGGIHQMEVTVYKKKPPTGDPCAAPMIVGPCRAALPRFYYNGFHCEEFTYGGCLGNENNFETLENCSSACNVTSGPGKSKDTSSAAVAVKRMAPANYNGSPEEAPREMTAADFAERCQAPMAVGPCRAAIPRHFYNSTSGACQSFIYGGCQGNQNNYGSVQECQDTCSVTVIPSPRKAPEGNSTDGKSTSTPPSACLLQYETGPCRGAFPSFYFSAAAQACLPFTYGGCQGNGNRFSSPEECMAQCSGLEGGAEKHGPPSTRTPAHLMLGTLAVLTIVGLVGLLLVMLRKSAFRHRLRDDKEELLPEDQLAAERNA